MEEEVANTIPGQNVRFPALHDFWRDATDELGLSNSEQ
jgi:hypothetical protein